MSPQLFSSIADAKELSKENKNTQQYIVAKFVMYCIDHDEEVLETITSYVRGAMLTETFYYSHPNDLKGRIRNITVYFDTQFLTRALGYAHRSLEIPCFELVDMLKSLGVRMKCFEATFDELHRIIYACEQRALKYGRVADSRPGSVGDYFNRRNMDAGDIAVSLRQVEDLLHERGIDVSYETVRAWWNRFGPLFAAEIRKKGSALMQGLPQWRWHLDEVFVRINGEMYYLWRAVDHEGEVLEAFVTKKRDRKAALKFLRKAMKRCGNPLEVETDRLRSYRAAMKVIGNVARQQTGRWLNNRAENSHQPFRRRERAMAKFRDAKSLQKFASIHSSLHNHFNQERQLYNRQTFELNRTAALAEWRQTCAV